MDLVEAKAVVGIHNIYKVLRLKTNFLLEHLNVSFNEKTAHLWLCRRWKGENVATTEVSDILTLSGRLQEANVYGVQVPGEDWCLCEWLDNSLFGFFLSFLFGIFLGHEGRIGMAAVTLKKDAKFDGRRMYQHVVSYLPSYARPRFIRIQVNYPDVTPT